MNLDAGIDFLADDETIVFRCLGMDKMKEIGRDLSRNTFGLQVLNDVYDASGIGGGDLGDRDTTLADICDELVIAAIGSECKNCSRRTSLTKMFIRNYLEVIENNSKIANYFQMIIVYLQSCLLEIRRSSIAD